MNSSDYAESNEALGEKDEGEAKVVFRKRVRQEATPDGLSEQSVLLGSGASSTEGVLKEFQAQHQEQQRDAGSFELERQLQSFTALSSNQDLPIYKYRQEIVEQVSRHQVVILTADTGSGKSSQVPQYLASKFGCVAVTEPRGVSAMSLAERVDLEQQYLHGSDSNYKGAKKAHFVKRVQRKDLHGIVYTTDEGMVKYYQDSAAFDGVDVLIIDEAHERRLFTDVLLGLVKLALRRRPSLRVIVTSATADVLKLQGFFIEFQHVHLHCEGRCFPVLDSFSEELHRDTESALVKKLVEIHTNEPMGHVLAFVGDDNSVFSVLNQLQDRLDQQHEAGTDMPDVVVQPLCNSCNIRQWKTAQEPTSSDLVRKIVICTNIAESSVTVDGVVYVVDSGYTEEPTFHAELQREVKARVPISQAAATQRLGRAGRVQPGRCYRLYPRVVFDTLEPFDVPEMKRKSLDQVILRLLELKVQISEFSFLDMPDPALQLQAIQSLAYSGCIMKSGGESSIVLSQFGTTILQSNMHTSIPLAKFLLSCATLCCLEDALTIAAMCMVDEDIYVRNATNTEEYKHVRQQSKFGDIVTYIGVYEGYITGGADWCTENMIKVSSMNRVQHQRRELSYIFQRLPELQDPIKHPEQHKRWVEALQAKVNVEHHQYDKYVSSLLSKYGAEVYARVDSIYVCQQAFALAFGCNLAIYDGKSRYKGYFDLSSKPGDLEVDRHSSVSFRLADSWPKYVAYAHAVVRKGSGRVTMKHQVVTESRLFYNAVDQVKGLRAEDYLPGLDVYLQRFKAQKEKYEFEKVQQDTDISNALLQTTTTEEPQSNNTAQVDSLLPVNYDNSTSNITATDKAAEARARYQARKNK